jgi:capsular exopolysaccharide synthesis family protein
LRTRLLKKQAKSGMRSLAITSTAQGEGKTFTSLNLALCYANLQDRSVLLIDSDLRTQGLSALLGFADLTGLGDILDGSCSYESAILRTDYPNLYFLPAGTSPVPAAELFSKAKWKEFITWCGETFQTTLADSPPVLDLADTELIVGACEGVLLVTRAGKTRRHALAKVINQVDAKKLAGVVFNDCKEAATKNYYRYGYRSAEQSRLAEPPASPKTVHSGD